MTTQQIIDKIAAMVAEELEVEPNEVDANEPLYNLGYDSLDAVELSLQIDKEFEISLEDEDISDTNSVTRWAELVEKKLS